MDDGAQSARTGIDKHSWVRILQPLWSFAIVGLIGIFFWREQADLSQAIRELRLADWRWLMAIVLIAIALQGATTQALSLVFLRLGRRIPFIPALMTHAEREMLATVMPLGGAASYIALATRFAIYGVTNTEAMLAVMLYSVIGHLSFLVIAGPATILLIERHDATGPVLLGGTVVLALAGLVLATAAALMKGKRLPAVVEERLPGFIHTFRAVARQTNLPARALLAPFVFSLMADLLGVLSMWAALRAVRVEAGLVTALVAYTVATVLLLAAPVFQGLGLVEVSVIYLLERLGVPMPQAIGATILYRVVDVWLPVVLGIGVHARYQRVLRGLPAYLPAMWTALSGVLALASVLPLRLHLPHVDFRRASDLGMLHSSHAGRTFTLIAGFLLLLLAARLVRRQYAAWVAALALSSALTVFYLARAFDDVSALISGTNVVILLLYRSRFRVRSDIPTMRRGFSMLALSFGATYAFGVASLWLADRRHFGREFSIDASLRTAFDIFFGFGNGGLAPRTARGEWIIDSMHLLAGLSIVISAMAILHPVIWRHRVQPSETERARALIERYGNSSLDRFKYWPDKLQFFATNGAAVVSYGLSGRVALVLGDPTASDDDTFEAILDEFLEFCAINGWEPAFHQVPPAHLDAYRRRGFTTMMIGRDAILPLDTFSLSGRSMGSFRSARNRAKREGRSVEHVTPPLSDGLLRELQAVSDEWLTLDGRRERTFALGQFDMDSLRNSPVLVLRSADGRAEAFIDLIPDGVPGEITFDLMRHRADAPNGSIDLLMLALIELGKTQGYSAVSLGMVPFVNPEPDVPSATADRAIAQLARPMSRFFASEQLFAYKDKFHPIWEPRYLVVPSVAQLPRVALALTRLSEIDDRGPLRRLMRHQPARRVNQPASGGRDHVA